MRKIWLQALLFAACLIASPALAQNQQCRTAPVGTVSSNCASEAFVTDSIAAIPAPTTSVPQPQGRITLASGTPVMGTSQTAMNSIYYTSIGTGNSVPVYNGTKFVSASLCAVGTVGACELAVTLGSNWAASSMFDWFVGFNGATATFCSGPDWSAGAVPGSNIFSASTRGSGAGSTELTRIGGLIVNKNVITCRYANTSTFSCPAYQCTYVGTTRTDGVAGQISFTYGGPSIPASLMVWNAYHRETICTTVYDTTSSWTYSSGTIRQANNSSVNEVDFVTGGVGSSIDASNTVLIRPANSVGAYGYIGLALDSVTVFDKKTQLINTSTNTFNVPASVSNTYQGPIGAHYIAATEAGDGATTTTYFGDGFMSLRVCLGM